MKQLSDINELLTDLKNSYINKIPFCTTSIGDGETMLYLSSINPIPGLNVLINSGFDKIVSDLRDETVNLLKISDYCFIHNITNPKQIEEYKKSKALWKQHFLKGMDVINAFAINSKILDVRTRYSSFSDGSLLSSIENAKVLLIGHWAAKVSKLFTKANFLDFYESMGVKKIKIVGSVICSEQRCAPDVPNVLENIDKFDYDVALVGMGIPANTVCLKIKQKGKIALNIGANMSGLAGEKGKKNRILKGFRYGFKW
jgi:hypothetical protein